MNTSQSAKKGFKTMTTNNEYYHQILENLTGYTWSNSLTTNEILNLLAFGYGMNYNCAKCNSKCLKDITTEITGVTQKNNKHNAYYLHKLCEYLTNEIYLDDLTDNEYLPVVEANLTGELDVPTIITSLTITVPLSLVYSDSFNITGVLTDESSNPIGNATIQLIVGNTVVDTATTGSDGEVSFTTAPVSMGTHSFQLRYDGDILHLNSNSSIVTRQIGKETSVLNLTSPINQSNHYNDGAVTVSGILLSDDNEPINGKSITVSENGTILTTLTTGGDGSFSGAVSNLAVGSHSLVIAFAGDDYYTGSSSNVSVTLVAASLTLVSDKSILSYADSEYATLTATYVGDTVSGKTVSFDVVDHDTGTVIRHIDSAVTDENGECSVYYSSSDAGDLYIQSSCNGILSIQTYVEDCYRWDSGLIDKSSDYTLHSNARMIHNANGGYYDCYCLNNPEGWNNISYPFINATNYHLSFTAKITNITYNNQLAIGYGFCGTLSPIDSHILNYSISKSASTGVWWHCELEKQNGIIHQKIYNESGTLVYDADTTCQSTDSSYLFGLGAWGGQANKYIKNIKIKRL